MADCQDPYYLSAAALWLRSHVLNTYGLNIETMDDLTVRSFTNAEEGILGVRPGLEFKTLLWVCAQSAGDQILEWFGPAVAPTGSVVPIQRHLRAVYGRFGTN